MNVASSPSGDRRKRDATRARRWIRSAAKLTAALLMLALFFRWFERNQVYHPFPKEWAITGEALGRPWQAIRFPTSDGLSLSGWYFPADKTAARSHLAVLVHHGNAGNVSHRVSLYRLLLDLGLNVLAYDYRGYGQSEGSPSEAGTYADGEAALAWLKTQGFPAERVIAHGESLGGGIAAEMALRHPDLRGVILRSTFTSIPDLGRELFPFLPVRRLATIHYDTRSKLPRIRVPVLLLHSRTDTLIRYAHAEANLAAANAPKWLREIQGDHNDQPDASSAIYAGAIAEFLNAFGNQVNHPTP